MPLPKPPTKKAALLSATDFESQAAPKPEKRTLKTHAVETAPAATLDLQDATATAVAAPPKPVAPLVQRRTAPAVPAPKPPRAAHAARHRPGQAVRAGHQRADARPDVALPL